MFGVSNMNIRLKDAIEKKLKEEVSYSPEIKNNQRLLSHFGGSDKVYERVFFFHLWFFFNVTDLLNQ